MTFRDLTRTSLRTQWRRQASESSEPRLHGFVKLWVDIKLVLLNLWVGASTQGMPTGHCTEHAFGNDGSGLRMFGYQ